MPSLELAFDIFWIYYASMSVSKKSGGRPRKSSEHRKVASLLLRLEAREKLGFTNAAKIAGLPLTGWIRERLRKVAARELEEANRPVPFLE